jgi:hypothetical protein
VECIRNDINIFSNRILELKSNKTSKDLKGYLKADLARAKALLKLIKGNSSLEESF